MENGSSALFVYGTLMRGEAFHHRVARARTIVPARTRGRLYELPAGYPVLLAVDDGPVVEGDLCTFDQIGLVLRGLDAFEDYDPDARRESEYLRVRRTVEIDEPGAPTVRAWCYAVPLERELALLTAGARPVAARRWSSRKASGNQPTDGRSC